MSATLKDVAKLSGVHPSTASRVLGGKEKFGISETTRQKIFASAQELKYQPDQIARTLRLKKSNTIGVVIPNISSPYFSGIAKTIDKLCSEEGYTVVVCDTNEDQKKEIRAINQLTARGVDGLIIAPVQDNDIHIKDLVRKNFPFVIIDRCFHDFETNAVISNDEEVAYEAVEQLASKGYRDIGFISGRANLYPVIKRLNGYKRALHDHGLNRESQFIQSGNHTLESGYDSMNRLLELPVPPKGIIVSGTIVTLGVIKAIFEKGLITPEDILIISFSDTVFAQYLDFPQIMITHQVEKMAHEAFKLLFQHLSSEKLENYTQKVVPMRFDNKEFLVKNTPVSAKTVEATAV